MGYSPRATQTPVISYKSAQACHASVSAHLFSNLLHVAHDQIVAVWVEECWEAPWVLESDKVRFLGVVVEMHRPECPDLLACHLRAVDALLQWRGEQRRPHQKEASVPPCVELGHQAVYNVGLGGDDVYGIHVALRLASLFEALDVGDVGVEDIIFLDHVVYELLGVLVDDEDLPLEAC